MVDEGDIKRFDIAGERHLLESALGVAFASRHTPITIKGFSINPGLTMVYLHRYPGEHFFPAMAPMDLPTVLKSLNSWLDHADYGPEPRTDGSTGKGFRLFNERWEKVNNDHTILCAVTTHWVVYGK